MKDIDKDLDKLIEEIKNHKFKSELRDERFEWMLKMCKKSLNSFKKKDNIDNKGSE